MKTLSAAMALVLAATAAPALAGDLEMVSNGRSLRVTYAEREVADAAGAQALLTRLNGAAKRVCRNTALGVERSRNVASCKTAALKDAVQRVDAPLLTAAYEGGSASFAVAAR